MSKRVVVTLETFNGENELVEHLVVKGRSYIASVIADDINCNVFSDMSDLDPNNVEEGEEYLIIHANGQASVQEMAELLHETNKTVIESNPAVKDVIATGKFDWAEENEEFELDDKAKVSRAHKSDTITMTLELPEGQTFDGKSTFKVDNIETMMILFKETDVNNSYISTLLLGDLAPEEVISLIRDFLMSEDVAKAIFDFGEELESNEMAKEVPVFNGFDQLAQFVKLQQDWDSLKEAMEEGKNVGITSEVM